MACGEEESVPHSMVVSVITDKAQHLPFKPTMTFVGRLRAQDDVKIQAKVTGYLKAWHFAEGDMVNKGDVLYEIDPSQFEADLAKAKANLSSAEAGVKVAERNFMRGKELFPKGAISASEMDRLEATKLQADADLEGAKAQVIGAKVNLSYTKIEAPINGRIGRSLHSVGDLISPESGELTSLVSIDPMQALFQVSEAIYVARTAAKAEMAARGKDVGDLIVKLRLTDQSMYGHAGRVDYLANRIDESTDTIEARASIPNPEGFLRPGQYIRVVLESPYEMDTLMIPQVGVQADQQGSFVFVVGAGNKVIRRNIETGERVGSDVVVLKGLDVGEDVVVQGVQKIRVGQTVKPQSVSDSNAQTPSTKE